MGYYMGDFYQQGSRGDPFLGALLGIGKRIFGGVSGLLKHGGGRGSVGLPTLGGAAATAGMSQIIKAGAGRIGGAIRQHPVLSGAGAAGVLGAIGGAGAEKLLAGGACPRGHHISKKHGHCVRNRRMHVTNPKALRRAIRRCEGFSRFAMRCIRLTHPKKKGRFGGFKTHRKKK